jgi:hypothetical protein
VLKDFFSPGNIIAIVVCLITLAYSYWSDLYRLDVSFDSQVVTVEGSQLNSDVQVLYQGKPVSNLYKSTFTIENSGSKSIDEALVHELPILTLSGQTDNDIPSVSPAINLLRIEEASKEPATLNIQYSIIGEAQVLIDFKLLNSGDKARFIITTDKLITNYRVDSRIKNIPEIRVFQLDYTRSFSEYITLEKFAMLWLSYLLFLAVRAFMTGHAGPVRDYAREIQTRPNNSTKDEFISFLKLECPETIRPMFLKEALKTVKSTNFTNVAQRSAMIDSLYMRASRTDWSITCIVFLIISVGLIIYNLGTLVYGFISWLKQYL